MDTSELLRDAYIALGSSISALRSMPVRRHADVEEDLAVTSAVREITEARAALAKYAVYRSTEEIAVPVDPMPLRGGRALGRPVVWEWIATLEAARVEIATQMQADGVDVPDDLPEASALEALGTHPAWRAATTLLFGVVVLALMISLVRSLL